MLLQLLGGAPVDRFEFKKLKAGVFVFRKVGISNPWRNNWRQEEANKYILSACRIPGYSNLVFSATTVSHKMAEGM